MRSGCYVAHDVPETDSTSPDHSLATKSRRPRTIRTREETRRGGARKHPAARVPLRGRRRAKTPGPEADADRDSRHRAAPRPPVPETAGNGCFWINSSGVWSGESLSYRSFRDARGQPGERRLREFTTASSAGSRASGDSLGGGTAFGLVYEPRVTEAGSNTDCPREYLPFRPRLRSHIHRGVEKGRSLSASERDKYASSDCTAKK